MEEELAEEMENVVLLSKVRCTPPAATAMMSDGFD
jgi:hypothetical protein